MERPGGGGEVAAAGTPAGQTVPECDGPGCCPPAWAAVLYTSGSDHVPAAAVRRCHVTFGGADVVVLADGSTGEGGAVVAGAGPDVVSGGAGADVLRGGVGADVLHGGGGADELWGEHGADLLEGGDGSDELRGGPGPDVLEGGAGDDRLLGGAGLDGLLGGGGDDALDGGLGPDILKGGAGDDVLWPGPGRDLVWAGAGDDRVEVFASCELAWGEVLAGGPGYDVLVLPVPLAQAQAQGVQVWGFEEVLVEPHPCRSSCAGAVPGVPPCGPGTCEETGGEGFACTCPVGRTGTECESCAPGYAGLACDRCAPGFHVEGQDGQDPTIPPGGDFEDAGPDDPVGPAEPLVPMVCVPDETCDGVDCGIGTCRVEGGVATCVCPAHRTGVDEQGVVCGRCMPGYEIDPNDPEGPCILGEDCAETRCGGRGICVAALVGPGSQHTQVACACDPGYAGEACQVCAPGYHGEAREDLGVVCLPDEVCEPDTCSGAGTCAVENGVTVCTCDPGYDGPDCSRTCVGNTCNGAGTCVEQAEGPVCQCDDPGRDPATDCATCRAGYAMAADGACVLQDGCDDPLACAGHGTCSAPDPAGHVCACDPGWAAATCDVCAPGYVRVGAACVPQTACDTEGCGGHGTCEVAGTVAVCACDDGFYGTHCQYTNPPTQVTVEGASASVAPGQTRVLAAQLAGIADFERDLVWTLVAGPGSLSPQPDGTAVYVAPSGAGGGPEVDQARIHVAPACCADEGVDVALPLVNRAKWIEYERLDTPWASEFAAFDQAILDYMWDRCIGALAVAVQRDGEVVYAAGYGRTRGAPTGENNSVWNTRCEDAFDPAGETMHPSNPMRIGSNGKFMLAAMVRWAVRQHWPEAQDADIESIRLCEDHPVVGTLLPEDVRRVLCGMDPLPVDVFADVTDPKACSGLSDDPCFNGGTCTLQQEGNDLVPTCTCPPGYMGARCQLLSAWAGPPPHFADPRWQQVTLGHLMSHMSGYPRSASQTDTLERLEQLRGYASQADLQAAEAAADAVNPTPLVALHDALQTLRGVENDPREAYFVPQPDLPEIILVTPYRALRRAPGSGYDYENGNFSIQHLIVEHLTGLPFAPRYDLPDVDWEGSALAAFLASEGIDGGVRSAWGIFPSPVVFAQREPNEPLYRRWSPPANQGTWYPVWGDEKVPDCVYDPGTGRVCDPVLWLAEDRSDSLRYGWGAGFPGPVPFAYKGTGISPGQGSMAVELPLWLRLMGRYTVSIDQGAVPYARPRAELQRSLAHSGAWGGFAVSYEAQFGPSEDATVIGGPCTLGDPCTIPGEGAGLCAYVQAPGGPLPQPRCVGNSKQPVRTYVVPPPDPATGVLPAGVGDAGLRTFACRFPDGVDLVVAVAQGLDPASGSLAGAYGVNATKGRLRGYVLHALCSVDWGAVQP